MRIDTHFDAFYVKTSWYVSYLIESEINANDNVYFIIFNAKEPFPPFYLVIHK